MAHAESLDGLCCPLTLEPFVDPCILSGDGHTYERGAIQTWLDTGKLTSPTTGAPLGAGGTVLITNHAVKKTIAELDGAPPRHAPPPPPPPPVAAFAAVRVAAPDDQSGLQLHV